MDNENNQPTPFADQLDRFADELAKAIRLLEAVASSIKEIGEAVRHYRWFLEPLASSFTVSPAEGLELSHFLDRLFVLARRQAALEKFLDDQNHLDFLEWNASCDDSGDTSGSDSDLPF